MTRSSSNQRKGMLLFAIIGVGVVALTAVWFFVQSSERPAPIPTLNTRAERAKEPITGETFQHPTLPADIRAAIDAVHRDLGATKSPTNLLNELRAKLQNSPPQAASKTIREFLDTKVDAPSGLAFRIGSGGYLTEHPSLRVFLLDQLAQIDPAAAATYAKTILQSTVSPDEWAVALRTYAKADTTPEGGEFLADRLNAMLTHEPWLREPSVGFLEAFDVAVHLGGTKLIPPLAALVRKTDNQAAAYAAYLALDRLTISDAAGTLGALQSNPELMQGRETTRANYFARADVRDEAQRQVVENYLLNPALTAEELEKFAGLYPSGNYMVSHNLLTQSVTPDRAWLTTRDAEALRHVQQMLEDSRFARLKPQLEAIQRRLKTFVQQAARTPE